MKLLCLIALTVCAIAHGANLQNEILPPGISVTKDLENSHYELAVEAQNIAEIKEVDLSESQVQALEEVLSFRLISGAIAEILEEFRDIVINGRDDVPPLDPLVIPIIGPFEYRTVGVVAEGQINNFRMEGLRWFVADRINVNAARLTFGITLTVPWLTITGSYDARARVALISHRAGGNIRIFANRIDIDLDMRMGTNIFGGGHLVLRELNIKIDIHDTQINITGMTGSALINNFISATIQNVSQEIIQNEMENVSRIISEELFDVINDVLKDFTVSDIFG
ncbi:uncharacterized protein LOC142981456 [Anticarsia gemmatalis]|uniref:uncharacterized protein LOC142981456 n=1 Tax=Anticarsia gemmatalis TaxID=129554 RepID=UPI003F776DD7